MAEELKPTQNSPLRKIFGPITDGTAKLIIKVAPWMKADYVTYFGLGQTIVGAFSWIPPEKLFFEKLISESLVPFAGLGIMLFGVLCDAIDGAVARNSKKPKGYNELDGMLTDVVHNRLGETAMAVSRIFAAGMRRDPAGIILAAASGITAPLPSLYRAKSEAKGSKVDELGNNFVAKLGTRVPRAVFAITSTAFPQAEIGNADLPVQHMADFLSTAGNIASLIERYKVYKSVLRGEVPKNLDEKNQYYGSERAKRLAPYSAINAAIILGSAVASFMIAMK